MNQLCKSILGCVLILAVLIPLLSFSAESFDIPFWTFHSNAGTSEGGEYKIQSTIGQTVSETSRGGSFVIKAGVLDYFSGFEVDVRDWMIY